MSEKNDKFTILAVDDTPENLDVVKGILSPEYIVKAATSGPMALKIAEKQKPDLILLDIMMPDMDGYDLYLEAQRRFPMLPVALMTAFYYDHEHIIKRSRVEGLEGVLFKKPIDPERLRKTLSELIRPPQPAPS